MYSQDILKLSFLVSTIETISNESFLRFFFMLKNNDAKAQDYFDFLVKKDEDFAAKFVDAVNAAKQKQNRVLMTFKTLNEMNAFIKAGSECGASWTENDAHCLYCYKFVDHESLAKLGG
jgi:hypothetical protein